MAKDTRTYEEKKEQFLKTTNRSSRSLNANNGYMSDPDVRKFTDAVMGRLFSGKGYSFDSPEQLGRDCNDFVQLCYDTNTVPTVTGFATWLGCDRDTIYNHANNPNSPFSAQCKNVIQLSHLTMENGAMSNKINSVLYMFLSKNYFGLKDDKNITVTPAQDTPINTKSTMDAIQKQLEEETTPNADYKEE